MSCSTSDEGAISRRRRLPMILIGCHEDTIQVCRDEHPFSLAVSVLSAVDAVFHLVS